MYVGRAQFIMATSERSLLTVLLPAVDLRKSLVPNLCDATALLLLHLGVDEKRAVRETEAMQEARFGRTESRAVLGSMNDFSTSPRMVSGGWRRPDRGHAALCRNAYDRGSAERGISRISG